MDAADGQHRFPLFVSDLFRFLEAFQPTSATRRRCCSMPSCVNSSRSVVTLKKKEQSSSMSVGLKAGHSALFLKSIICFTKLTAMVFLEPVSHCSSIFYRTPSGVRTGSNQMKPLAMMWHGSGDERPIVTKTSSGRKIVASGPKDKLYSLKHGINSSV